LQSCLQRFITEPQVMVYSLKNNSNNKKWHPVLSVIKLVHITKKEPSGSSIIIF
jgi:hypothetical protein